VTPTRGELPVTNGRRLGRRRAPLPIGQNGHVSAGLHDHDHAELGPSRTVEVSDGLYAYVQPDGSWWINNTGFLVARKGVVSVDACATERRTRAYIDAIAAVTDQPVRTLINTHHHGDHTHGNSLFPTATIVGHHRIREEMRGSSVPRGNPFFTPVDWGDIEIEPPFLTYGNSVDVYIDDLRCEVRHVGTAAHTTNDSIVWIAERSVLYAGDLLFNGGTPFVIAGSVSGLLAVLDDLRALGARTIVPGHGEVCGQEVIDAVADYLVFLQQVAVDGKAAGLSPLDAARQTDLGRFADLLDAERIVGNLYRAYAELDGAAPGAPIDLLSALSDMVAFNGGQPLRCLA
jgi:cyclase